MLIFYLSCLDIFVPFFSHFSDYTETFSTSYLCLPSRYTLWLHMDKITLTPLCLEEDYNTINISFENSEITSKLSKNYLIQSESSLQYSKVLGQVYWRSFIESYLEKQNKTKKPSSQRNLEENPSNEHKEGFI